MLVNHLAETSHSRESIDWDEVKAKPEFAGNTATNLKRVFSTVLRNATRSLNTETDISWEQTLDKCREYINQASRRKTAELRRFQVIQYFENYVKKHDIVDFL